MGVEVLDKEMIMQRLKEIDAKFASDYPVIDGATKAGVGFGATIGSMSINDWMGLAVGFATLIYMCFQIDAAWRRRKKEKSAGL